MPTPQRVLGKLALLFQQDELIMQLLPYEDLYIATHLPYNMLSKKIQHITDFIFPLIEPCSYKSSHKTYFGHITLDGFKVSINGHFIGVHFHFQSSHGYFLETKNGKRFNHQKMRLSPHWTLLIGLFFSLVLYFYALRHSLRSNNNYFFKSYKS